MNATASLDPYTLPARDFDFSRVQVINRMPRFTSRANFACCGMSATGSKLATFSWCRVIPTPDAGGRRAGATWPAGEVAGAAGGCAVGATLPAAGHVDAAQAAAAEL